MKAYKIKEDLTKEQLEEAGFLTEEKDGTIQYVCFVPQPLDGELAQSMVKYYLNPEWRKKFYVGEKRKVLKEMLGIAYDNKKGTLLMSEKLQQTLCLWSVQFFDNDRTLFMTNFDPFDSEGWAGINTLNKYCGKLINELKEKEFIEEVEVDIG